MKNRLTLLVLSLCLLGTAGQAFAQKAKSHSFKPKWAHKLPKPSNNTFTYELDFAVASSLDEAREKSLASLIANSGFENGVVVVTDYESKIVDSQVLENGQTKNIQQENVEINSRVQGNEVQLHVKQVAEYWTRDASGTYNLTKLYAKATSKDAPSFDNVTTTTKYGARGLWRSLIIPGWGQFHKGANLKGGLMLGGTAALAAGVIFTEGQRSDYNKRMFQTHDANHIRSYQTKRDNFATARNICIGAAAALYLYNLIDAIAAPGAERIVKRKDSRGNSYVVAPSVSTTGAPVMTAAITF